MNYRHELKYMIHMGNYLRLRPILQALLEQDPHNKEGDYHVKSCYFDDLMDSAYEEKMAGVASRRKYRIRTYNHDQTHYKIEIKEKEDAYIRKQVVSRGKPVVEKLMMGEVNFEDNPVLRQWQKAIGTLGLTPRVTVAYDREAYVLPELGIRITFDKGLRVSEYDAIHEVDPIYYPVLDPEVMILEIKYERILPAFLKNLLSVDDLGLQAVSKYTLCYDQLRRLGGIKDVW